MVNTVACCIVYTKVETTSETVSLIEVTATGLRLQEKAYTECP